MLRTMRDSLLLLTVARCTPRRDLAPTFLENEMEKCWEMFNTRIRGRRKKKELFLTGIHTCFVKVAESFVCLQKLNLFCDDGTLCTFN